MRACCYHQYHWRCCKRTNTTVHELCDFYLFFLIFVFGFAFTCCCRAWISLQCTRIVGIRSLQALVQLLNLNFHHFVVVVACFVFVVGVGVVFCFAFRQKSTTAESYAKDSVVGAKYLIYMQACVCVWVYACMYR